MKLGTIANAAAVLALGLAAWTTISNAQGPLYDRVDVNLPYTVTIGDRTLQPGQYVIQQLRSASGDSRVLLIYSDNGMKFETSAMTIPALDPNTARDTKVILHHFGNDYFFDKVWIQGKDYGYEFPLPDSVKARQREEMQPVSVAANYSTTSNTDVTTNTATNNTTTAPATNGQATTAPAAATTQTTNQAATAPTTAPATTAPAEQPTTMAQNTMPPATAQSTMPSNNNGNNNANNSANRDMNDTGNMPHTSAGWMLMLLSGGALSGAGLTLRRKR
jgi:hypothetical protein